ncbi:MAG: hypothetical protein KAY24_16295, partial [Candidatus Eisenbacteria sp.]|nr:hypothetical protein [Candidatus Eisenbacteria bacterium]
MLVVANRQCKTPGQHQDRIRSVDPSYLNRSSGSWNDGFIAGSTTGRTIFGVRSRLLLIIAMLVSIGSALGDEVRVPEEIHVPILLKILTFDRALQRNASDRIHIAIIHAPENANSQHNRQLVQSNLTALLGMTINGLSFDFSSVPFASPTQLDS